MNTLTTPAVGDRLVDGHTGRLLPWVVTWAERGTGQAQSDLDGHRLVLFVHKGSWRLGGAGGTPVTFYRASLDLAGSDDPARPSLGDRLAAQLLGRANDLLCDGEVGEGGADHPELTELLSLLADLRYAQGWDAGAVLVEQLAHDPDRVEDEDDEL